MHLRCKNHKQVQRYDNYFKMHKNTFALFTLIVNRAALQGKVYYNRELFDGGS